MADRLRRNLDQYHLLSDLFGAVRSHDGVHVHGIGVLGGLAMKPSSDEIRCTQLPSKAGLILGLAVAGLVLPVIGIPFAVSARIMGRRDLRKIELSGQGLQQRELVQTGVILGTIGIWLWGLVVLLAELCYLAGALFEIAAGSVFRQR